LINLLVKAGFASTRPWPKNTLTQMKRSGQSLDFSYSVWNFWRRFSRVSSSTKDDRKAFKFCKL